MMTNIYTKIHMGQKKSLSRSEKSYGYMTLS